MTLFEKIKTDQLHARKNRDTVGAALLTTLISETEMVGKNAGNRATSDDETIAVVKKFIKNIDETIVALQKQNQSFNIPLEEKTILQKYLPKQLNEIEIEEIAENFATMGEFMKHMKIYHNGQYDGKLASTVFNRVNLKNA